MKSSNISNRQHTQQISASKYFEAFTSWSSISSENLPSWGPYLAASVETPLQNKNILHPTTKVTQNITVIWITTTSKITTTNKVTMTVMISTKKWTRTLFPRTRKKRETPIKWVSEAQPHYLGKYSLSMVTASSKNRKHQAGPFFSSSNSRETPRRVHYQLLMFFVKLMTAKSWVGRLATLLHSHMSALDFSYSFLMPHQKGGSTD